MRIENFILIYYVKDDLDIEVDEQTKRRYISSQKPALHFMVSQIKSFYPDSRIHVLTNTDVDLPECEIHRKDFGSNHTVKFEIYSLLDEPAMYMDCDIVMHRRFKDEELACNTPFKLFNTSMTINLSKIAADDGFFSVPDRDYQVYNAGMIWVPRPDEAITKRLQLIERVVFCDKEKIKAQGLWPYNDEYALTYMLHMDGISFPNSPSVNLVSWSDEHSDVQTVHYTGLDGKRAFLQRILKI
jgi:hypothetical protein